MTVKQLADALGYANAQQLHNLLKRNQAEVGGKTCVVKLTIQGQGRNVTVLNYHRVIRVAMLSDASRAIAFRDFAESVLYPVMTQGYYLPAEAETALVQKLTGILEERVDGKLSTLDDKLSTLTQLVSQKIITAEPVISEWPTPAQRIAQLIARRTPRPY